jgi:sRNA-binding carbon storage regulator CsrA
MSGASIEKKIQRGYGKAGIKLGFKFGVYRPDNYVVPLADRNFILQTMIGYAEDDSYAKNPELALSYQKVYVNYAMVEVGDILYSEDVNVTLVVIEKNMLKGAIAVKAPDRVNLLRPVYSTASDKKTTFEQVATNLPVAFSVTGGITDAGGLSGVGSKMGSGQSQVTVWFYMPKGEVKYNDVIEIDGKRYLIQRLDSTDTGTFVQALSTKVAQ